MVSKTKSSQPTKSSKKTAASSSKGSSKVAATKAKNPLFVDRPKTFGLGGNVLPPRDVTRQVRWPLYVVRQRRRRVLERRMKVPPAVHQFRNALDKSTKKELLGFLQGYAPEVAKKALAVKQAAKAKSSRVPAKPAQLSYGIQEVTRTVESKRARLVVIAHDVDPLELVLWLPQLCVAQGVPYCIVKSKSELGKLVGHKTCTAIALTEVRSQDQAMLEKLLTTINAKFTERFEEIRRAWGGNQQSTQAQIRAKKREKALAGLKASDVAK
mmetsp:Transcript_23710/g.32363  ORF Transcript_23710/g.32363 Transcript_23710/m.32363 type:complete len:269 (+) Transcript_23710:48-854(+)|eukprot:CAMPEP_0201489732 /NCGR_PEP_ID=MMETSP0151_2-20130828/23475_1 /ASSEMBLY_ACC=CAM_ASM_000257 /TAXON_ID=200890 /ORGANISM="Paramoeba atlantica, Strain 621/1 / CCAP 1560/9" /LENGTH=268 /DNA_ID=CAMNT_0047875419 /DNA_START=34 /DNA_END=840 /DNA_ORIENTATION=+